MANLNLFSYLSKKFSPIKRSTQLKTGIKTRIVKTSKNIKEIQVVDSIIVDADGIEKPLFNPNSPVFRPFISESKVN